MDVVSKPNVIAAVWEHLGFMTVLNHFTWASRYIAFVVKR